MAANKVSQHSEHNFKLFLAMVSRNKCSKPVTKYIAVPLTHFLTDSAFNEVDAGLKVSIKY